MWGVNPSRSTCLLIVAFSMIGTGLIHLAAVRSHIAAPAAVASFTGLGLAQILIGSSLLQPGAPRVKRTAVVIVGTAALGAWLVSRTVGLPAVSGHAGPEAVGASDLVAVALQLISIALILLPARDTWTSPRARFLTAFPLAMVSAFASLSLLSVAPHGHGPDAHPRTPQVASVSGGLLVKRSVPVPATTPTTVSDHVDAPGAPAHSH